MLILSSPRDSNQSPPPATRIDAVVFVTSPKGIESRARAIRWLRLPWLPCRIIGLRMQRGIGMDAAYVSLADSLTTGQLV